MNSYTTPYILSNTNNKAHRDVVDPLSLFTGDKRAISLELFNSLHTGGDYTASLTSKSGLGKPYVSGNRTSHHNGSQVNSEGTHESLAIVSMFADEVHTTGGIGKRCWSIIKCGFEEADCLITKRTRHEKKSMRMDENSRFFHSILFHELITKDMNVA